jgi:hypothetical protein
VVVGQAVFSRERVLGSDCGKENEPFRAVCFSLSLFSQEWTVKGTQKKEEDILFLPACFLPLVDF